MTKPPLDVTAKFRIIILLPWRDRNEATSTSNAYLKQRSSGNKGPSVWMLSHGDSISYRRGFLVCFCLFIGVFTFANFQVHSTEYELQILKNNKNYKIK